MVIEGYSFGSKGAVYTMAELKYRLMQAIVRVNKKMVIVVAPTSWKAKVLGAGHLTKDEVIDSLLEISPALRDQFTTDHNKYDSFAIALYGIYQLHGELKWTEPKR